MYISKGERVQYELGSPLFKPIFAGKTNVDPFLFPPVLNFVSQKISSPDRTCGGTRIRIKKSRLEKLCIRNGAWMYIISSMARWVSPGKIPDIMKWKATVDKSFFRVRQWLISRSSLAIILRNAFVACTLDVRCWTNTHMVALSLSFRKACVFVSMCVCVRVGMWVYARVTSSRAQSWIIFSRTYGWSEMKVRREFE